MKRDLRVYIYQSGGLKIARFFTMNKIKPKYSDLDLAKNDIEKYKELRPNSNFQFVICEYFSSYDSKIIGII